VCNTGFLEKMTGVKPSSLPGEDQYGRRYRRPSFSERSSALDSLTK